ncbi:MAG: 4-phosphoerythronate dehydrogenase, partial [Bacteroidales bacterium]|nr:4-phosphoerythronate dehydrogenase [Bacteroidales bacterium]
MKEKELKIVADKQIPYLKGVLEPHAAIRYIEGNAITPSVITDADALLIRTRTLCNQALLSDTNVRFIASATSGTDHVDKTYCRQAGIRFRNAPGCNASAVAQYVTSALMYLLGKEKVSPANVTLGIVGLGHVGTQVLAMAKTMGMRVLINDPPRERQEKAGQYVGLEHLLEHADIVTVHVPLNNSGADKTLHLVDKEFLGKMKPGSWLINTSRGEVAKTSDLLEAPSDRKYILDVWENEPLLNRDLLSRTELGT